MINTHKGLFKYNRLVFGRASAPTILAVSHGQDMQSIPGSHCYLDNTLLMGASDKEHLGNLQKIHVRLSKYGHRANKEKYEFSRYHYILYPYH